MVGDSPYDKSCDVTDIAFGTKNQKAPLLLQRIFENLSKTVKQFKPLNDNIDSDC